MRVNASTMLLVGLGTIGSSGVSVALGNAVTPSTGPLQEFVARTAERRVMLGDFSASGVHMRSRVSGEAVEALRAALAGLSVERAAGPTLRADLMELIPDRECFAYDLRADGDAVSVARTRLPECDTALADLVSRSGPGANVIPLVKSERMVTINATDLGPAQSFVIQDDLVVRPLDSVSRDSVLSLMDLGIVDWSPVLDDDRHPAGQTRWYEAESPDLGILRFEDRVLATGAVDARSEYRFAPSEGMRLVSVASELQGQPVFIMESAAAVDDVERVPLAVLRATRAAGQTLWDVDLLVLEEAQYGPSARTPHLLIPSLRLDLAPMPNGDWTVQRVLPQAIHAFPPEERLAGAIGLLLQHWGSTAGEFDLDGDGTVGQGDLSRAMEVLQ